MRKAILWLSAILLMGGGIRSACAQEISENNCLICHADQWEEMKDSVHGRHQITCNRCHGGDPTKEDMEEAKAAVAKHCDKHDVKGEEKSKMLEACERVCRKHGDIDRAKDDTKDAVKKGKSAWDILKEKGITIETGK